MEWSIEYAEAVTTITAMMLSLVTALLLGLFSERNGGIATCTHLVLQQW